MAQTPAIAPCLWFDRRGFSYALRHRTPAVRELDRTESVRPGENDARRRRLAL